MLAAFASAGFFVERPAAEQDPGSKQLIPYCVLRQPDRLFWVQRKPAAGETRLHGRLSIGLGGHVNPEEYDVVVGPDLFRTALARELGEELVGTDGLEPRFLGLLNDDQDEVGRVHAGLVHAIDLPAGRSPLPAVREISKMAGGWGSLAELDALWQDPARFESWSRILIQAGIPGGKAVFASGRLLPPACTVRGERGTTHG
jgi:predicted NUDIX family phosphoesterase